MNIQYIDPFVRGWRRTKKALFQPFDLRKWFVVGFTAFLAALSDCNNGGNGSGVKKGWGDRHDLEDMIQFPHEAWRWLMENPGWFTLIIIGIFFLFIIGVLVTWVSARGKFMFLDNVIYDRALVVNPWNEYRKEGNSFFIWQFIFGLIVLVTIAAYLFMSYIAICGLYESDARSSAFIMTCIWLALGLIAVIFIARFIDTLLTDFIVPVMYKNRISAAAAWARFMPSLSSYFIYFIGYGLIIFVLSILVVIGVVMAGFFTCCIGFIFLVIPYINSVVTLPISYTYRAFSVEFLEQFSTEFHLFPKPAGTSSSKQKRTSPGGRRST